MEQSRIPVVEEDEQDSKYKASFLNSVFLLAGIIAFGMGFIRWQQSAVMGMIDFGFSGICFALLYYLRNHKEKVEIISSVALLFSFLLFFAIYLLAPYNTTRIALFFLLSSSALFLKGRKIGLVWLIFILAAIVSGHLLSGHDSAYSHTDILTACLYLIALYVIFYNYGAIKDAQKELLKQHRDRLESDVALRTADLREVNRLLGEELFERKRSEEEIRKMSRAVEQSPAAIMITNTDGELEYVNPSFTRITGYSAEEVIGKNPRLLQSGKTPREEYVRLWDAVKAGKAWQGEFYNKRKNEELYWESATIAPIMDNEGAITHYVAIKDDITERKKAADALRASEDRLNNAQRIARIGSWELDLATNVLTWSDEIYRIFEIDPAEFSASYEAFLMKVHPDDREAVNAAYTDSLANRTPYLTEHRLLFPDGRVKQVCEQCETFYDADGTPLRSLGTMQDITERKKMENELRFAKEEWERTFDAITDPVMILDMDYRIVKANRSMAAALNVTPAEAVGMTCYKAVHNKEAPTELCPHARLMEDGQAHSQEITEERIGGHFLVSVSPLHAPDGALVGSIHAARDITPLKEAQDALNRANKLLERQATTDSLTGIFNRLKFDEMLAKELSRSRRYEIPLSLVMFDVDHFKNINDTLGHHIGDLLLQELTAHLSRNIRKHDCFARWGGDEFIMLLTHAARESAALFAENCRAEIESMKFGGLEKVTCSFGVTDLREEDDISKFTRRVDDALYKAKSGGRNRVEILP